MAPSTRLRKRSKSCVFLEGQASQAGLFYDCFGAEKGPNFLQLPEKRSCDL